MRYLKNVASLKFDASRCTGCGRCLEVCPQGVFLPEGRRVAVGDRDACMECGACSRNCPFSAISVAAGVGCANAVIRGALAGTEPDCSCADSGTGCCG